MEEENIELLKTKIKMLKSRLAQLKSKQSKTDKEVRKEKATQANIEHFNNELKEMYKKSPRINRITKHINIDETKNDETIIHSDSPVRKPSSKSPIKNRATKSILKKGGRRGNTTRKNNNPRN